MRKILCCLFGEKYFAADCMCVAGGGGGEQQHTGPWVIPGGGLYRQEYRGRCYLLLTECMPYFTILTYHYRVYHTLPCLHTNFLP